MNTRRQVIAGSALLGSMALPQIGVGAARADGGHELRLAIATFSLRYFSRAQAIRIVSQLGIKRVHVKSHHIPYYLSADSLAEARREFEQAGLEIVAVGNIPMRTLDEDYILRHLQYAKNVGTDTVVCAPLPDNLAVIEKHARRLGLRIAVHNHGPEDENFPDAASILGRIKEMNPCMGLCYDVGHAARTGVDVVEEIEMAADRLFEVHIKDLTDFSDRSSQVVVGRGKIPLARIFRTLIKSRYSGVVGLEYEVTPHSPERGIEASLAYMRGVLDGLA